MKDLLNPVSNVKIVDRNKLQANDYNPNVVNEQNLDLLVQSIMSNGWTMPIVVRPDYTIIDGFHRWTISGREPLKTLLGGKVPIVIVEHETESGNIYGTVTHNRARGTHLLEPMKNIVKKLIENGKTSKEISKELGMSVEEVFRLSDFTKEDFLNIMARKDTFSRAKYIVKY
jgi:ParB-like chromosome segregation protein Spo0J